MAGMKKGNPFGGKVAPPFGKKSDDKKMSVKGNSKKSKK